MSQSNTENTPRELPLRALVVLTGIALALQVVLYLVLEGDSYLRHGLFVLTVLVLVVHALYRIPLPIRFPFGRGRTLGAVVAALSAIIYFVFFGVGFSKGVFSVTYADLGFEPSFLSRLAANAAFQMGIYMFSVELLYRGFFLLRRFESKQAVFKAVTIQAVLSVLWIYPALCLFLEVAALSLSALFLVTEFLFAFLAGLIFVISRNALLSGCWAGMHSFIGFYLLSDIEFDFATSYYIVSSSYTYYYLRIILLLAMSGVISLLYLKRYAQQS